VAGEALYAKNASPDPFPKHSWHFQALPAVERRVLPMRCVAIEHCANPASYNSSSVQ
jgi:hypothetical protein